MWLNLRSDKGTPGYGGQIGTNVSHGISRQNSTRSSTRSAKSGKSSSSKYLKRLEEFELKTNTSEWQKTQDYKIIRDRRKKVAKQINDKLHIIRMLYIPSILGIILGIIFLFGATIRTLGDGTIFWTQKEVCKIIGIVLIVLGVILLLTTVGLESSSLDKLKKAGIEYVEPVIHPDFMLERVKIERQTSKESSGKLSSSYDPDCSELERRRLLWSVSNPDEEDGFLCSSIASSSSGMVPRSNTPDLRVRILCPNSNKNIAAADDNSHNESMSCPCHIRATESVPYIKVTDMDEISLQSALSSASGTCSVSRSSSACSVPTSCSEKSVALANNPVCNKNGLITAKELGKLRGITEETFSDIEEHN